MICRIYELHIRDFSANDASVPAVQRGTVPGLYQQNSNGMHHLRSLRSVWTEGGNNLLPSFDIASVNERQNYLANHRGSQWHSRRIPISNQAAVTAIRNRMDSTGKTIPWHFLTPEGSYAVQCGQSHPRYRRMVMGLHRAGLRVIQTTSLSHQRGRTGCQNRCSIRSSPTTTTADPDGLIFTGSCCPDTASEHHMMEKLIVDAVVMWAREYKIDGFRFDIMSFHSVSTMQKIQQALAATHSSARWRRWNEDLLMARV